MTAYAADAHGTDDTEPGGDFLKELKEAERVGRAAKRAAREKAKADGEREQKAGARRKRGHRNNEATLTDLARSGLDARDAEKMGLIDRTALWMEEQFDQPRDAYEIPYYGLDGKPYEPEFSRFRFTQFTNPQRVNGKVYSLDEMRYTQRVDTGVRAYFPPGYLDWLKVLADPTIQVVITEGEKKSAKACKEGLVCLGLGGVWNFRREEMLLDGLSLLAAGGRKIYIAFDSDRLKKNKDGSQQIRLAELTLAMELRAAGARVFIVKLDGSGGEKAGLDDVLKQKNGRKIVAAAITASVEHATRDTVAGMRKYKKSNGDRVFMISEAFISDLRTHGRFIRTQATLLYFDSETKQLIALDDIKLAETNAYIDEKGAVCSADAEFARIMARLKNTAFTHGEETEVARLASWHADRGVLYIAKNASQLFEVTATGWKVVDNGAGATADRPGTLIHARKLAEVVVDKHGGRAAFESVISIPNFVDGTHVTAKQSKMLWAIYCIAVFFPQAMPTRIIPLFHGPAGSGKSSGYRALLRTIYGKRGDVTVINPKKPDALESALVNNAIVCLDNVDGSHPEIRDIIAAASTGGVLTLRMLFTTMGVSEYNLDCLLGATSRDPKTFARGDLIDRLLYLMVDRRTGGFISESALNARIDTNRPKFWRWLLEILPACITALQGMKRDDKHDSRMADFAAVATAIGPVLGYDVEDVNAALTAMNAEAVECQMEYSTVVSAIGTYLNAEATALAWSMTDSRGMTADKYNAKLAELRKPMTATEFLAVVKSRVPDFAFKDAASFGRALLSDEAALKGRYKFAATLNKHNKTKVYSVEPKFGFLSFKDQQEALRGD